LRLVRPVLDFPDLAAVTSLAHLIPQRPASAVAVEGCFHADTGFRTRLISAGTGLSNKSSALLTRSLDPIQAIGHCHDIRGT
jgi:hypothetical protein